MELTALTLAFTELLKIEQVNEAPQKLLQVLFSSKNDLFDEWISRFLDLSVDNLQPVFRYNMADRKDKLQNYTTKSIPDLLQNAGYFFSVGIFRFYAAYIRSKICGAL